MLLSSLLVLSGHQLNVLLNLLSTFKPVKPLSGLWRTCWVCKKKVGKVFLCFSPPFLLIFSPWTHALCMNNNTCASERTKIQEFNICRWRIAAADVCATTATNKWGRKSSSCREAHSTWGCSLLLYCLPAWPSPILRQGGGGRVN